jgi:signal peptidase II
VPIVPGATGNTPKDTATGRPWHATPAWRRPSAVAVFVAVVAAGLAGDLWSKQAVFSALLGDPAVARRVGELAPGREAAPSPAEVLRWLRLHRQVFSGFRLTLSTNPGVVFGLPMPPWAVAVATVFTIALVAYFFATSGAAARWTHVALAMVLSGALGNFYDRMIARVRVPGIETPITGPVRDFLDFSEIRVLGVNYPYIFNVADVLLVVGVAMLILHWAVAARRERKARPAAKAPKRHR